MSAISEYYLLQLEVKTEPETSDLKIEEEIPNEMKELLQKYQPIFEKPHGPPPKRAQEHRIQLVEGTGLVKVRPYRYPFS